VAGELVAAAARRGAYRGAREELTPVAGDPRAAAWLVGLATALLLAPGLAGRLSGDSVTNYALSPAGWRQLEEAGRP
jgi:hypothetical protein